MSKHALWIIVAAIAAPFSATMAASPDTIKVFDASGKFDNIYGGPNGAVLGGTISIDVTNGTVVSESLYAKFHGHTTLFDAPNQVYGAQGIFGEGPGYYVIGHSPNYSNFHVGDFFWNVGLQTTQYAFGTLEGYSGGPLCSYKMPCTGPDTQDYPSQTDYGHADKSNYSLTSGSLALATAPEIDPASSAAGLTLLISGLAILRGRKQQPLWSDWRPD